MPLAVRIGIHTGPVVVGALGGGGRRETLALGESTNLAARVQSVAAPDTVVVSAATQRLVAGIFVAEDLGKPTLKGVREPRGALPRRAAERACAAASTSRPGGSRASSGARSSSATLVERWERAHDGEGQNVLVSARPGVGKSRLAYQLRERLAGVPAHLARVRRDRPTRRARRSFR